MSGHRYVSDVVKLQGGSGRTVSLVAPAWRGLAPDGRTRTRLSSYISATRGAPTDR